MTARGLNRREFLWGLSQSLLTSLVLGRAFQQVAAADIKPTSMTEALRLMNFNPGSLHK